MRPDFAATLLAGEEPSEDQKRSRDFFSLGFGGKPVMLPDSRALIPNPILRSAYRIMKKI